MEFFRRARVVRLRSHHEKYLLADEDEETVFQDRDGSTKNARWTVEIVENTRTLRFKSFFGKYLTASNMPFRLGLRGKKVLQSLPKRLDSSLEWEPIRCEYQVRLKTPYGQFLRANGGVPPWRNSITHDVPHRTAKQDWVLWNIDVLEFRIESHPGHPSKDVAEPTPAEVQPPPERGEFPPSVAHPPPPSPPLAEFPAETSEPSSPTKMELMPLGLRKQVSREFSDHGSPMKKGRMIYYQVADDKGDVHDDGTESDAFSFLGSKVNELKKKLKEETGLEEFDVCSRNPLNGQLYPLRLHLPPNNNDMHVVLVPSLP